jgi:Ca-activated chloride channel homolog
MPGPCGTFRSLWRCGRLVLSLALLGSACAQSAPRPVAHAGASSPAPAAAAHQDSSSPQTAPGQPSPDQDAGGFVFKTQAEEVVLHATVVDSRNHPVTGLPQSAFTVFEDGKPQTITSFATEDVPVALGIVIDNSGSMRSERAEVNRAAVNLVKASNPRDGVFVVNFGAEAYLDQDFTSDVGKLEQALAKIDTRGSTAVYDALVASARHLDRNAKLDKKILLLITDGEDNASQESSEEALQQLQQKNGPIIYTIALLGARERPETRSILEAMARGTGGAAFFPATLDDVNAISKSIAHDIRSQYTIGYRSSNPRRPGEYRTIRVAATQGHSGGLEVRTRSGYYVGEESGFQNGATTGVSAQARAD